MHTAQAELGERIDRRPGKMAVRLPAPSPERNAERFARRLGNFCRGERAPGTHRRPKRNYVRRVRTPSMLDPHVATIEGWLAAEPQLTALAVVGRLSEAYPEQFCTKQHSRSVGGRSPRAVTSALGSAWRPSRSPEIAPSPTPLESGAELERVGANGGHPSAAIKARAIESPFLLFASAATKSHFCGKSLGTRKVAVKPAFVQLSRKLLVIDSSRGRSR